VLFVLSIESIQEGIKSEGRTGSDSTDPTRKVSGTCDTLI
jgi:hypothetical protein